MIVEKNPSVVGIYRLTMKTGSDNFRRSTIHDVIQLIREKDVEVVIYEPVLEDNNFDGLRVIEDFNLFKDMSDVIVTNRLSDELKDIREKVYTRDLFSRD